MTTFKNSVNAFGNSSGDDIGKHATNWKGPKSTGFPKGKLKHYPGEAADISSGNRRLAKSKHGAGGGCSTSFAGRNAFSKGKK